MSIAVMKQALAVLEHINQFSIGENAIALPGEIDAAMDNLRAAIEHYDQTSLELCKECGWRALIPGDGCLVCARQKAKPVAWMYDFLADDRDEVIRDWVTQSQEEIKRENGFNVRPLYIAPPAITRKPVAYVDERIHGWPDCFLMEPDPPHTVPLYTAPRQWVGLTDEERYGLYRKAGLESYHLLSSEVQYKYDRCIESYARAIEAKLKEKNA
jgi:hypothetical protein